MGHKLYLESLDVFRKLRKERTLAWTLQNLGYVARTRGAYAEAHAYFDEALQLFSTVGAPLGVAACLAGLAYVTVSQAQ